MAEEQIWAIADRWVDDPELGTSQDEGLDHSWDIGFYAHYEGELMQVMDIQHWYHNEVELLLIERGDPDEDVEINTCWSARPIGPCEIPL